jgi:hypothetical protein
MDKLLIFLTLISGLAIAGALIAICATLGYSSLFSTIASVVAAFTIAWPGAQIALRGLQAVQGKRVDQPRSSKTDPTE